ncbi:CopG family transcriptional regulator [Caenimonas terrae]|uniref:CopG family transcriptional regulator n=1 Tax=Caenimonas terrae TaxID=696074 RepID=A0ABW0NB15_9BURK
MEDKARLVVLIDPANKAAFEAACSAQDLSSSEVIRQLIVDYLARHGVGLSGGGDAGLAAAE